MGLLLHCYCCWFVVVGDALFFPFPLLLLTIVILIWCLWNHLHCVVILVDDDSDALYRWDDDLDIQYPPKWPDPDLTGGGGEGDLYWPCIIYSEERPWLTKRRMPCDWPSHSPTFQLAASGFLRNEKLNCNVTWQLALEGFFLKQRKTLNWQWPVFGYYCIIVMASEEQVRHSRKRWHGH